MILLPKTYKVPMKLMSVWIASTNSVTQQKIDNNYLMNVKIFNSSPASFFDSEVSKSGGKNPKCAGSNAEILSIKINCFI